MSAAFTGADGRPRIPGRGDGARYPDRGQRSVLNGKPVIADGKGNWLDASQPMTPMSEREQVGSYSVGLRFPSVEAIGSGEYGTNVQKPAAPAKPAKGKGLNLPPSAAVPGTGPKGNEVGSDADPNTPGLQGPGAPGARTNENGIKQYGRDLSSLNAFTSAFTGGYELTDIKTAFQSEDLPGAYQNGSNSISTKKTAYELPEGATPSPLNKGLAGAELEMPSNTTYEIGQESVPGTLGRSSDAQEGASDKPDIADNVRTIRMQRKNARDDGSFRGFQKDNNNRLAQQPKAEEPDAAKIAQEQRRNKIRSTFLDMDTPIIKASVAANAVAGYGKDSDGNAQFNYGGELVQAKDGMQQQAKNAAMMGKDPSEFLAIKLDEVKKDQEKNM